MNANLPPADYYLAKAHSALQDAVPLLSACQWDNNPETHALYQLGRAVEYLTKAVEHMRQAEIRKEEER